MAQCAVERSMWGVLSCRDKGGRWSLHRTGYRVSRGRNGTVYRSSEDRRNHLMSVFMMHVNLFDLMSRPHEPCRM